MLGRVVTSDCTWKHRGAIPSFDEIGLTTCSVQFRLNHQVSLLGIHWAGCASTSVHYKWLLFMYFLVLELLVLLEAKWACAIFITISIDTSTSICICATEIWADRKLCSWSMATLWMLWKGEQALSLVGIEWTASPIRGASWSSCQFL